MLAQEKEEEWDRQKGLEMVEELATGQALAIRPDLAMGLVLAHLSPLGLESARQSAQGLVELLDRGYH